MYPAKAKKIPQNIEENKEAAFKLSSMNTIW